MKESKGFVALTPSLGNKLGVLILSMFVMVIVTGFVQGLVSKLHINERDVILIGSSTQAVLAFIIPSFLAAYLCNPNWKHYLGVSNPGTYSQYIGMAILLVLFMPAMNYVVDLNENMHLPESMSGIEATLRNLETNAERVTDIILNDSSIWGLVSGVLIVGCLTGIAEEMFFRAGIQKAFVSSGWNVHVAVWTTAIIFSAIHFQFFGFIPRMLLGAMLGYLYVYTGSLWVPAACHALNNSMVVISSWMVARGYTDVDVDSLGMDGNAAVWFALASVLLAACFIKFFGKTLFRKPSPANSDMKYNG